MKKKQIIYKANWEVKLLLNEWNSYQTINNTLISKDYYSIFEKDFGLMSFFDEVWVFGILLSQMISKNNYDNYYKNVNYCYALLTEAKANLNTYLKKMFNTANGLNIAIKLKKFDDEKSQLDKLISVKQKELSSNPLIVQRKINILKEKINQINELKNKFIDSSKERSKQEFEDFKIWVSDLLINKSNNLNSLNNIFHNSNLDELDKLKSFIKKYLPVIKVYIENCLRVVSKLKEVKIEANHELHKKNKNI